MRLCEKSFLSTYMDYTQVHEAPEAFHFACGLTCLSLASKGARYLEFEHYRVYSNIYTLLLARTAECRKGGATGIVYGLMEEAGLISSSCMSEKITEAGLWKQGEENIETFGNSTIFVFADELSLFLSKHEAYAGLIPFLTRFYEVRRGVYTKKTSDSGMRTLVNPFVVTLLATTPHDFSTLIPAAASGTGFAPRMLIIYQEEPKGTIAYPKAPHALREKLVHDLKHIMQICNPKEPKAYVFTPEAEAWYKTWYETQNVKPEDPELDGWFGRKHTTLLKVVMLLALSELDDLYITPVQLETGLALLERIQKDLSSAYRLLGEIPQAAHGRRILDQLTRRGGQATRQELQHLNSGKMRSSELTEVLIGLGIEGKVEKIVEEGKPILYRVIKKDGVFAHQRE